MHPGARHDTAFNAGCTTAPSRVRPAPLMISSSQFSASAPVFLSTIRPHEIEQIAGIKARRIDREAGGQVGVAHQRHAMDLDDLVGLRQWAMPPCSTARSTMIDPGFIVLTISSVIRRGAFVPESAPW